jgi:phage N-6-adenine-methyltransferase
VTAEDRRDDWMGVMTSSATPEWPTPQWLVDQLAAEFGPFDLDPAATAENAKAPLYYTVVDDGLAQEWKGRAWLNPPYGAVIGRWVAKASAEVDLGNAELVVCLVPARTDTRWWRQSTTAASLVRLWPGRIRFGCDTQGYARRDVSELRNAPFPSAVIVFGRLPGRHGTLARFCAACRRPWFPARSDAKTCSPACRQALKRSQVTGRKRDRKGPRK